MFFRHQLNVLVPQNIDIELSTANEILKANKENENLDKDTPYLFRRLNDGHPHFIHYTEGGSTSNVFDVVELSYDKAPSQLDDFGEYKYTPKNYTEFWGRQFLDSVMTQNIYEYYKNRHNINTINKLFLFEQLAINHLSNGLFTKDWYLNSHLFFQPALSFFMLKENKNYNYIPEQMKQNIYLYASVGALEIKKKSINVNISLNNLNADETYIIKITNVETQKLEDIDSQANVLIDSTNYTNNSITINNSVLYSIMNNTADTRTDDKKSHISDVHVDKYIVVSNMTSYNASISYDVLSVGQADVEVFSEVVIVRAIPPEKIDVENSNFTINTTLSTIILNSQDYSILNENEYEVKYKNTNLNYTSSITKYDSSAQPYKNINFNDPLKPLNLEQLKGFLENHIIKVKQQYKLDQNFSGPNSDPSIYISYTCKYGKSNSFYLRYDNIFIDDTSVSFEFSDKNNFDETLNKIKNELLALRNTINNIDVEIKIILGAYKSDNSNKQIYLQQNNELINIKELYIKEDNELVSIKEMYIKFNNELIKIF